MTGQVNVSLVSQYLTESIYKIFAFKIAMHWMTETKYVLFVLYYADVKFKTVAW